MQFTLSIATHFLRRAYFSQPLDGSSAFSYMYKCIYCWKPVSLYFPFLYEYAKIKACSYHGNQLKFSIFLLKKGGCLPYSDAKKTSMQIFSILLLYHVEEFAWSFPKSILLGDGFLMESWVFTCEVEHDFSVKVKPDVYINMSHDHIDSKKSIFKTIFLYLLVKLKENVFSSHKTKKIIHLTYLSPNIAWHSLP